MCDPHVYSEQLSAAHESMPAIASLGCCVQVHQLPAANAPVMLPAPSDAGDSAAGLDAFGNLAAFEGADIPAPGDGIPPAVPGAAIPPPPVPLVPQ